MSPAPLVSCIIPVFNGETTLRETLESVRAQTYSPIEILVVDDGSTDGTKRLVETFAGEARYLWQSNAGPVAARNAGIRASTGEFLSFLDSDDRWHPDKVTRQVDAFAQDPALDVCLTLVQNVWSEELRDEEERLRDHFRGQPIAGYTSVALMARRSLFDRVGLYDEGLAHGGDADWFARVEESGAGLRVLDEVLVYRRLHAASRSRAWSDRSQEEILRLMKSIVERRRGRAGSE